MRFAALPLAPAVLALIALSHTGCQQPENAAAPAAPAPTTTSSAPELPALPAKPGERTTDLAIEGMHCAGCAGRLQEVLLGVDGVRTCLVSIDADAARIVHDPAVSVDTLSAAISDAGEYVVTPR